MDAAQSKVLQAYPQAGCYHLRGMAGATPPYDKDHWRVYRDSADIGDVIGSGATEAEAWADAVAWASAAKTHGP